MKESCTRDDDIGPSAYLPVLLLSFSLIIKINATEQFSHTLWQSWCHRYPVLSVRHMITPPRLIIRLRKRTSYKRSIDLSHELLKPRTRILRNTRVSSRSKEACLLKRSNREGHGEWLGVRKKNLTPRRFRTHVKLLVQFQNYVGLGGCGVRVRWDQAIYKLNAAGRYKAPATSGTFKIWLRS